MTAPTTYEPTLDGAARALREGTVTSVELTRRCLDAAEAHDDELGVFLARFDDRALAAAEAADAALAAGDDLGPLHGIPLGIKDIITTTEAPTTAQSLILDRAWGPAIGDAPVAARLRAAGAVFVGKASTMEFAIGRPDESKPFPIPRNPWNPLTWPGGSSSGTGAGVAAGMFLGGLGTDTGGSIRIPAAFCGISGLMPTFGRVPKSGCVPLGYSLDHIGPMARAVRDCAHMLQVLAGHDPSDACCVDEPVPDYGSALTGDLTGVRIGVDTLARSIATDTDPSVPGLLEAAVRVLAERGADIVEVELPYYREMVTADMVTLTAEAMAYHATDLRARWNDYFAGTRTIVASGALYSAADYVQAQRVRRVAQKALAELYRDVDLVLTPTCSIGAPALDDLNTLIGGPRGTALHTAYWDSVGNPVLSLPMGFTADGLPLGMQLAGRPFDEATVLRAGDAYQQHTDWHLRTPEGYGS
ncbi:amidase [Uniformispora flossi]|uniref:amidase n=1 Tax=Uniformispora flossi TaxID=3390723 RepID=UPI003C2E0E21